jgi:hypothetical protein
MFAFIKSITGAANKLARNLAALADTVSEVNTGLRQQLALDRPEKPARKARQGTRGDRRGAPPGGPAARGRPAGALACESAPRRPFKGEDMETTTAPTALQLAADVRRLGCVPGPPPTPPP